MAGEASSAGRSRVGRDGREAGRLPSPLFEEDFVHGEAQDGADGGAEARPQPEGGVLEVGLRHVSVGGSRRGSAVGWRVEERGRSLRRREEFKEDQEGGGSGWTKTSSAPPTGGTHVLKTGAHDFIKALPTSC